jgi:hypothetical protein
MGQADGGLKTRILGAPIEKQNCFFALGIGSPAGWRDNEIDHAVAHAARLEQPKLPEGVLGPDLAANRLGDMNRYLRVGESSSVYAIRDALYRAAQDELRLAYQFDDIGFARLHRG